MIRALAGAVGGGVAIVAFAALWLVATPPAGAAECVPVNASWYGKETCRYNPDPRCPTASGILHYDGSQFIAAHRSLPFHTRVRVTYRGRSIVVPIEDRGPAKRTGRSLDLSQSAARALGFKGIGKVCMEAL